MRKTGILAAALMGATLLAAGAASAQPPHCPPGHAKKGWCSPGGDGRDRGGWERRDDARDRYRDRDRDWDRDRLEDARDRAYEEGYRDAMQDAWRVGQRLPRDRYRVVPDFQQYGWSQPAEGRSYVYADDRYYLIEQATGLILDILTR